MSSVLHVWTPLALALVLAAGCGDNGGTSATDGSSGGATDNPTSGGSTSTTSTSDGSSGGASTSTTSGGMLSHAVDIQPIWDAKCVAACHDDNPMSSGTATTGLQLLPAVAYDSLIDIASVQCGAQVLVAPSDREASFLWHKINGDQTLVCASGGSKMPIGKTLTPEEIDTIGQWIDAGAPP